MRKVRVLRMQDSLRSSLLHALGVLKMNRVIILVTLFFVPNTWANECRGQYIDELKYKLANDDLGIVDETGKLEKFTHHDYAIACEIVIYNRYFKWFTDENEERFLIQESLKNGEVYYGLFRRINTL